MRGSFTLIALVLSSAIIGAAGPAISQDKPDGKDGKVWKWVDKDGVTHYSDQPGPGAVKVDLRIQTYSAPPATFTPPPSGRQPAKVAYRSISIVSPADGQTVFAAEGPITVLVNVEPGLQGGHRVRVSMDGQQQGEPSTSLSATIRDIPRGSHAVSASIVAENGSVVMQSTPITFTVQQQSVLSPAKKK